MTDNTLRWQDEILQLMYWMKGESLGANPTAEELNRLLNFTSAQLEAALRCELHGWRVGFAWPADRRVGVDERFVVALHSEGLLPANKGIA